MLFVGPSAACTVEHTPHRNSLAVVVSIEPGRENGHDVLCRAQEGFMGYARPDELRPLDDFGDGVVEETREKGSA